ncbi:MAG: aldose epimerase [Snowella sp.]|nr:aldose epimerase [Snowella sp.]
MYAIAFKQEQYLTYILTDQDKLARLEVVPERGGIVTRWTIQGQEILYLDQERFQDPSLSVRGGIPILFPICGNLPNNHYTHNQKAYKLQQHGFARELPWQVVDQKTESSASLTLRLTSTAATKALYPFDFQVDFTYQLQGNTLTIHQRYTNLSTEKMPFSTGLHPYFGVKDKSKLSFEIPASMYQDQKSLALHPFEETFDFAQPEIDAAFKSVKHHTASFTDSKRKLTLNLQYSDEYSTVVFWTLADKDYICLEPWTAPRNSLNTGEKLLYLNPQETLETTVTLRADFF